MYRAILFLALLSFAIVTGAFVNRPFPLSAFAQDEGADIRSSQTRAEAKVEILSPANGDTFITEYDTIYFQGGVTGYAGDMQSLVWQWESSIDGLLGNGSELEMASSLLSLASHVITLQVQDGETVVGEDQISITISARYPPPPPNCEGEAKVKITSPQTGGKYYQGSEINFSGEVTGYTGNIDNLEWEWKSGEVPFGNQREFTRSDLQVGHYLLFLTADVPGDCRIGTDTISIVIESVPAHSLHLPLVFGAATSH
ncbi:MAG: hypothetical protein KF893_16380 [Caldilineaceae bacterium]|nr:hypothetical protein [Caldilineaceae bacterium]